MQLTRIHVSSVDEDWNVAFFARCKGKGSPIAESDCSLLNRTSLRSESGAARRDVVSSAVKIAWGGERISNES